MLIAIDPGMNSPGVALFRPDPRGGPFPVLFAAGRVSISRDHALEDAGQRWYYVARDIVQWISEHVYAHTEPVVLAFEKPQWYARSKSKGDPNDLVGVAGVAANVTGMLQPNKIISPEPATWIGQCPKVCPVCKGKKSRPTTLTEQMMSNRKRKPKRVKAVCSACHGSAWGTPRGQVIRRRLSETELALIPDQNDAIDAVGIGLWACGRLERTVVFSNGHDGR